MEYTINGKILNADEGKEDVEKMTEGLAELSIHSDVRKALEEDGDSTDGLYEEGYVDSPFVKQKMKTKAVAKKSRKDKEMKWCSKREARMTRRVERFVCKKAAPKLVSKPIQTPELDKKKQDSGFWSDDVTVGNESPFNRDDTDQSNTPTPAKSTRDVIKRAFNWIATERRNRAPNWNVGRKEIIEMLNRSPSSPDVSAMCGNGQLKKESRANEGKSCRKLNLQ